LPAGRSATWEFALLYTAAAVYPGQFYCPAGSHVILHACNLSQKTVLLKAVFAGTSLSLTPGGYRKIDLGNINQGDYQIGVVISDNSDLAHNQDHTPNTLILHLYAGIWPGQEAVYQTAWLLKSNMIVPQILPLPSGRKVEIFVGSLPSSTEAKYFKIGNSEFMLQPGKVTLTEIFNPKGNETAFCPAVSQKAWISIR
jgi:hypothetical protein